MGQPNQNLETRSAETGRVFSCAEALRHHAVITLCDSCFDMDTRPSAPKWRIRSYALDNLRTTSHLEDLEFIMLTSSDCNSFMRASARLQEAVQQDNNLKTDEQKLLDSTVQLARSPTGPVNPSGTYSLSANPAKENSGPTSVDSCSVSVVQWYLTQQRAATSIQSTRVQPWVDSLQQLRMPWAANPRRTPFSKRRGL